MADVEKERQRGRSVEFGVLFYVSFGRRTWGVGGDDWVLV